MGNSREKYPFKLTRVLAAVIFSLLFLSGCSWFSSLQRQQPGDSDRNATIEEQAPITRDTAPESLPVPGAIPTGVPDLANALDIFPLYLGTSWTYTYDEYSKSLDVPDQVVRASLELKETVVDLHSSPPFTLVQIMGNKEIIEADPGWQERGGNGMEVYEYWYILLDGAIYMSKTEPDPANIQIDQLLLEFQLPLVPGANWFPDLPGSVNLASPGDDFLPLPGMRVVSNEEAYQTAAGAFERCFLISDIYNSGNVFQWFCDGVGLVARKYDHLGSPFGFSLELTGFSLGSLPSSEPAAGTE